jgi:glycosyltransferase involved in cell wall biosynthesis
MNVINQVVASATLGDAVTGQAFAWQRLLSSWGYTGQVFAEHVDPRLVGQAQRLDGADRRSLRRDDAVLHYSVWSEAIPAVLDSSERVALYYHNVTPGNLLRDFNPVLADFCDRGRQHLGEFRDRVAPVLAVSRFNAADLLEAGLGEASVIPLLLDLPDEIPERDPNREPIVLTVGRIVPNKRLEDVVKVFTLYQRHRAPNASLVVVGSDSGFETYRSALDVLVASLGAERVFFTGAIPSDARDSWYRRADVYLSMSVHEGFCAPLIEALAHGVPVVARAAAAVPETLGEAGVLIEGDDLPLAAEALHELVSSETTRGALAAAAESRLAELRPEVIAPQIRTALEPLLESVGR